ASFSFNAGLRTYFIDASLLDKSDPVIQKTDFRTLVYPDIIPGFRFTTKKFYLDVAARQLTTPALQDFRGHKIGSPSKLNPTLFFSAGRLVSLNERWLLLPSLTLTLPFVHFPNVELNTMLYYDTRMGFGVALRNLNFVTAIYQLKVIKNVTVGLAYSVSVNSMFYAAPNSFELMIGVPPYGMNTRPQGKISVSRCPTLDY
ncbi:MAG TPA: type IX secretion system membrane protein PorP/SprF, partial [Bacteroidia bacterium]|nr:type IX secretion system membrane protein PorP/SprF [Bacteroidia bacterium]